MREEATAMYCPLCGLPLTHDDVTVINHYGTRLHAPCLQRGDAHAMPMHSLPLRHWPPLFPKTGTPTFNDRRTSK
jgi:hypothetical protein